MRSSDAATAVVLRYGTVQLQLQLVDLLSCKLLYVQLLLSGAKVLESQRARVQCRNTHALN